MQPDQLQEFIDPVSGAPLRLHDATMAENGHVFSGVLRDDAGKSSFPVREGIPRFVPAENYATNFGLQWQLHAQTQLDSHNGSTYTRDRFHQTTRWPAKMPGERILEAGSGAGRFSEILLSTGCKLYSFDFSAAVVANYASNGSNPNLCLFQGDIYNIPFPKKSFDRVFCLGVIQHTPDVEKSFRSLASMVRPGGQLAVDVYPATWRAMLHWKYLMRPLTTRMKPERLYNVVDWYAPKLMGPAKLLRKIGGRAGRRFVPIMDQTDKDVSPDLQRRWTVLDTYDALGAKYDSPQTDTTLRRWFAEEGFGNIDVFPCFNGWAGVGTSPQ